MCLTANVCVERVRRTMPSSRLARLPGNMRFMRAVRTCSVSGSPSWRSWAAPSTSPASAVGVRPAHRCASSSGESAGVGSSHMKQCLQLPEARRDVVEAAWRVHKLFWWLGARTRPCTVVATHRSGSDTVASTHLCAPSAALCSPAYLLVLIANVLTSRTGMEHRNRSSGRSGLPFFLGCRRARQVASRYALLRAKSGRSTNSTLVGNCATRQARLEPRLPVERACCCFRARAACAGVDWVGFAAAREALNLARTCCWTQWA